MSPSKSGDAAQSVPVPVPVPVPEVGEVQGHGREQGLLSASAPSRVAFLQALDDGVMMMPPAADGHGYEATASSPTTPVPSIEKYVAPDQNDISPQGPVSVSASASASAVPIRPKGPSLLTQQLAEARGIPPVVTGQSLDTSSHSNPRLQHSPYDPATGSHPKQAPTTLGSDTRPLKTNDDPEYCDDSDGSSLTPRASPRAVPMATTAAIPPISLPPRVADALLSRTLGASDIGDVEHKLNGHMDLFRSSGRGNYTSDRSDKERRPDDSPFNNIRSYSGTSAPPTTSTTMGSDRDPHALYGGQDPGTVAEHRSPARPRKPDHRVSVGPEKAWSIGTDDLNNDQDGQVEKAIAEVLAGVEPNARSRKASHSLRFFKEGLPEEKLRRKESRLGPKEKLLASDDTVVDRHRGSLHSDDQSRSLQPSPGQTEEFPGRITRTRTFPLPSTDTQHHDAEPLDYFQTKPKNSDHIPSQSPLEEKPKVAAKGAAIIEYDTIKEGDEEAHEGSSDAAVEDGDLSGEEKISSAVFVPHKGPHAVPERPQESELDSDIPGKPHQRSGDGTSWLVKADEPEVDDPGTPEVVAEDKVREAPHHRLGVEHGTISAEPATRPSPVPTTFSMDHDFAQQDQTKPPQLVSPGYEDHVHDHQLSPEQPLDAIELIPYRHQVGGHTTIWRFSKRAVCKQLNNRENEFYEKIERYHRDLLPFLPRYIGVLNVTFSKQSRRKSTVRKDGNIGSERKKIEPKEQLNGQANGSAVQDVIIEKGESAPRASSHSRLISQSLQSAPEPIPTVTFLDNQHILPRSLLHPTAKSAYYADRGRSSSVSALSSHYSTNGSASAGASPRPSLEDRHANSWGTTVVNKKLRHEVFNDAFLKQPISVQRHKKAYQRTIPRKTLDRLLRPTTSDPSLMKQGENSSPPSLLSQSSMSQSPLLRIHHKTQSDVGLATTPRDVSDEEPSDVTGTSAPEPEILSETMSPQRRKRRHSGSALRSRPKDVSDSRGNLRYWEEPDEVGYKGDNEDLASSASKPDAPEMPSAQSLNGSAGTTHAEASAPSSTSNSLTTSPTSEFKMIPRPVNPKEAQTQHDSRVSYFLLLEDLAAGMKKPCIMDLKMGTRQYGVDASLKKQASQQRKCAETTSRELGVRVCGLQVWDAKRQEYVFKDKYYGRNIKAGQEFQDALTRFLYDGVDRSSILRHIPTILQKLSKLDVIVRRLRGYRFYAASLLVTYDGIQSEEDSTDTAIEDSTTDFATDTEDVNHVRKRKNRREIDFKIADFANSLTPGDLSKDKSCPPQHPDEPDRGFLKGLRSLRKYFLKIQQDTRAELGLLNTHRNLVYDPQLDVSDDEELMSN